MTSPVFFKPRVSREMLQLIKQAVADNTDHPVLDSRGSGRCRYSEYFGEDAIWVITKFSYACAIDPESSPILQRAARELPSGFFTILIVVCGMRKGFGEAEKLLGWPARSAKLVLAMALAELQRLEVV